MNRTELADLAKKCACSDPCFVAFVEDRIVEPCEHLRPKK